MIRTRRLFNWLLLASERLFKTTVLENNPSSAPPYQSPTDEDSSRMFRKRTMMRVERSAVDVLSLSNSTPHPSGLQLDGLNFHAFRSLSVGGRNIFVSSSGNLSTGPGQTSTKLVKVMPCESIDGIAVTDHGQTVFAMLFIAFKAAARRGLGAAASLSVCFCIVAGV